MYKVIELGHEFAATGEPRVQVLNQDLVKTASSKIQAFWDTLDENEDNAYLWVIGVSAYEYYGCNNNGDAFREEELKNSHQSFVEDAHVFLHHVNKDPNKSIGKPMFAFYNEAMHRVELILKISKKTPSARDIITRIKKGEQLGVSMGCRVKYDICSICGHQAKTRKEYCDHTKYNMKAILPDGRKVFVFNPEPRFFDISVVNKPADPTALALDKIASQGPSALAEQSAKLGEDAEYYSKKIAALDKFSDIVKKVDGITTDVKDGDEEINVLKKIDPEKLDYPVLGFEDLQGIDSHPECIFQALASFGAPPSLGEMAYAFGKKEFGDDLDEDTVNKIFSILPQAIRLLRLGDAPLEKMVFPMFGNTISSQGLEDARKQVEPVAKTRVIIIKQAADQEILDKFANEVLNEVPIGRSIAPPPAQDDALSRKLQAAAELRTQKGPGFYEQYTVRGQDGTEYQTDRRSVAMTQEQNATPRLARKVLAAALGTAAVGAFFTEPDLLRSLVTSGALGAGAMAAWDTQPAKKIYTEEGFEIPANTLFQEKSASTAAAGRFARENLGTLIGLSIPAALGLDYVYNKKIRHKDNPRAQYYMGKNQRRAYRAGKVVADNPVTTTVAGGLTGAAASEGIRTALSKIRNIR